MVMDVQVAIMVTLAQIAQILHISYQMEILMVLAIAILFRQVSSLVAIITVQIQGTTLGVKQINSAATSRRIFK